MVSCVVVDMRALKSVLDGGYLWVGLSCTHCLGPGFSLAMHNAPREDLQPAKTCCAGRSHNQCGMGRGNGEKVHTGAELKAFS